MSSDTPPINSSVKMKEKSPLDPIAEFQKLKLETAEINKKIMKGSPFMTPTADSSNEMLGQLLTELRMMRKEMKEIKEDDKENKRRLDEIEENQKNLQEGVGGIKSELENQKEVLKIIEENQMKLQNDVTGIKKDLVDIQKNQQNQEQLLHELKENISMNLKKTEKEPELYSQNDIRRRIFGKWRNVKDENDYRYTKFENNTFMLNYHYNPCFTRYKLGVKDRYGFKMSVENNKIVRREFTNKGEEYWKNEYYIENEKLIYAIYRCGEEVKKDTYERVGDPYTKK